APYSCERCTMRSVPSLCSTPTAAGTLNVLPPFGPFTLPLPPASAPGPPLGGAIGLFATRDIELSSGDDADDFAALASRARFLVGHQAEGSRHDRDPEAAHALRHLVLAAS